MKSESTEDWMKRIGSKQAMEKRQKLRMEGKLNVPIKVSRDHSGLEKHSLYCKCERCIPPEIQDWIKNELPKYNLDISKPKPHTIIPSEMKTPKKRSKWNDKRGRSSN